MIVGAIAVSSCLIAISLLLTSGGDSGQPAATGAKKAKAGAKASADATEGGADATEGGAEATEGSAGATAGPTECSVEATVEGASCLLGAAALEAYDAAGEGGGSLVVVDPDSGKELTLECSGSGPTICSGKGGVTIYLAR